MASLDLLPHLLKQDEEEEEEEDDDDEDEERLKRDVIARLGFRSADGADGVWGCGLLVPPTGIRSSVKRLEDGGVGVLRPRLMLASGCPKRWCLPNMPALGL